MNAVDALEIVQGAIWTVIVAAAPPVQGGDFAAQGPGCALDMHEDGVQAACVVKLR